jgi:predicted nucleotidyltransferase
VLGADQRAGHQHQAQLGSVVQRGHVILADAAPRIRAARALARGSPDVMGPRRKLVEENRDAIAAAVRRHRGTSVAIFGSVARGDDGEGSDIDFLVEFATDSSLFDLLHLQDELESILDCPVDVVSAGGLKERDDHIRREAVGL